LTGNLIEEKNPRPRVAVMQGRIGIGRKDRGDLEIHRVQFRLKLRGEKRGSQATIMKLGSRKKRQVREATGKLRKMTKKGRVRVLTRSSRGDSE